MQTQNEIIINGRNEKAMCCVKVHLDGDYIVFTHENDCEYDPSIKQTKEHWWLMHMRGKMWFSFEVERAALQLLNKTENDWPDSPKFPHQW